MKILVAIDSSASSDAVVSEVAARPWPSGTVVRVLNVVESIVGYPGVSDIELLGHAETEAARALVKSAAERIGAQGIDAHWVVTEGYTRAAILDYARAWQADFVFLGSHGHSRLTQFFLGSVAKTILQSGPCSVEIVRATENYKSHSLGIKILLATDGSHYSEAAARSIANRPWPEGSKVKTISVVDSFESAGNLGFSAREVIDRIQEEKMRLCQDALSKAGNILLNAGLKAAGAVLTGDPRVRIIDEAKEWKADLVVLGTQGRSGFDRLVQGSVSEAVAIHVHCSVEVVRERVTQ